jgi:hypothetical protein
MLDPILFLALATMATGVATAAVHLRVARKAQVIQKSATAHRE